MLIRAICAFCNRSIKVKYKLPKSPEGKLPGVLFYTPGYTICDWCSGKEAPPNSVLQQVTKETYDYWKNKKQG